MNINNIDRLIIDRLIKDRMEKISMKKRNINRMRVIIIKYFAVFIMLLISITLFGCKPGGPITSSGQGSLDNSTGEQSAESTGGSSDLLISGSNMDPTNSDSLESLLSGSENGNSPDTSSGIFQSSEIFSNGGKPSPTISQSSYSSQLLSSIIQISSSSTSTTPTVTKAPTLTTAPTPQTSSQITSRPDINWYLAWSDEFNGNSLDKNKWTAQNQRNEVVYLTDREENIKVENGNLVITARREKYLNMSGIEYTSANIVTADYNKIKFDFLYGRMEIRAKLPYGQGLWPAFWTMGNEYLQMGDTAGWPYAGEIDIMEMVGEGSEAGKRILSGNKRTTCNLHWGKDRDNHKESFASYFLPGQQILADDYHIYAIEWDENEIRWYFDDVEIQKVNINDPTMMNAFHKPHWLIIGVHLRSGYAPAVNETTPLPQKMYVDYVRYYIDLDKH